ncbi:hypothetical protein BH23VER1_BH23VER1_18290 [soil metagenome]
MKLLTLAVATALAFGTATSHAIFIVENFGGAGGGSGDVDNVLFDSNAPTTLLTAETNSGASFVDFTSMGGLIQASASGQADILGAGDNVPLMNLMFQLQNGETFTKAQFNPLGADDGMITISVDFLNSSGVLSNFTETYDLGDTGQNQFTVLGVVGDPGEAITKITPGFRRRLF